ncbi:hypothetical protein OL548_34170 (plasmid) [Lysinibacillus sp. MHQ-1]|nr:hypothetical protein OL548_34170 [Lysinibacillus sp. MHQ-1]
MLKIENENLSDTVDLSKYLIDVELEVKYSTLKNIFKQSLHDIFTEEMFIYQNEALEHIPKENSIDTLKEYIVGGYINIKNVIIVHESEIDELEKIYGSSRYY